MPFSNYVKVAHVFRGLFICEFAYSHLSKIVEMTIIQSKIDF
jgi:hypothetical protein